MGPEQREAFDQLKRLAIEPRSSPSLDQNCRPDWRPMPPGMPQLTMTPAERAYPIQDRELAVVQSLEHFYPELLGQKFDVITDHEALVHFSTKRLLGRQRSPTVKARAEERTVTLILRKG
ncbi:hypothetical protein HRG_012111 [Hirsutella rhossiliensis]